MIKKIGLNAFLLFLSQVIARGIGFFYFIFLARVLGVENFGVYAFVLAFVNNFVPVADFGLERLVLRDISRTPNDARSYLKKLFPLRLTLALLSYIAAALLGVILGQPTLQIFYFLVFGLFLFPNSLIYLLISFQNAKEKMQYMAIVNIVVIALTAFLGVGFVFCKLNFIWILTAFFWGNLAVLFFFLSVSKKMGLKVGWEVDLSFYKKIISQSWVFAVIIIISVFYLRLSIIILGLLKGPYFTGLYSSVYKFIEAGLVFPQALTLALFPISSRLFIDDRKKLRSIYFKGLFVLLCFSLIPALILILFSKDIIKLAYGISYLPASGAFSILGIALVLFFINSLAGNIIQSSPKVKKFLPWSVLNLVTALILFLVLIPKYSIIGAAWGVVGGEIAGLIINNYFVLRLLKEEKDNG